MAGDLGPGIGGKVGGRGRALTQPAAAEPAQRLAQLGLGFVDFARGVADIGQMLMRGRLCGGRVTIQNRLRDGAVLVAQQFADRRNGEHAAAILDHVAAQDARKRPHHL